MTASAEYVLIQYSARFFGQLLAQDMLVRMVFKLLMCTACHSRKVASLSHSSL